MKKTYKKPEIEICRFSLEEHLACNCCQKKAEATVTEMATVMAKAEVARAPRPRIKCAWYRYRRVYRGTCCTGTR